MPKLTVYLPEAAYRAALRFDSTQLSQLLASTIIDADAEQEDVPHYDRETNEEDLESIGRSLQAEREGQIIPGDVAMAQLRNRVRASSKMEGEAHDPEEEAAWSYLQSETS